MTLEELSYIINNKGSSWENFFLSLESKDPEDWKIFFYQNSLQKIKKFSDKDIPNDYQIIRYFTEEEGYDVYLKKRLFITGENLFYSKGTEKSPVFTGNGFASASIIYVLKRQQGQIVERFRGRRIRALYEEIAGLAPRYDNH